MGQRLVLRIENNGEVLANSYYHWSAYTRSANALLLLMVNELEKADSPIHQIQDPKLKAIRLLEVTGAKLTNYTDSVNELEAAKQLFPEEQFETAKSRNDGLISITAEGIEDSEGWSEGGAALDIGSLTVSNDCFYMCSNKEEYVNEYMDSEDQTEEEIEEEYNENVFTDSSVNVGEMTFEQFREWDEFCDEIVDQGYYAYVDSEGQIISFIE